MVLKWKKGVILWLIPIRYWEDPEPEMCRVEENGEYDAKHLYVYHELYGHTVYVPEERCYQSKQAAIRAALLLRELKNLKENDENDWLTEEIIQSMTKPQFSDTPVDRETKGTPRIGYILMPKHAKNGNLRVPGDLDKSEVVFWCHYEATQSLVYEPSDGMKIVKVQVTPVLPLEDGIN